MLADAVPRDCAGGIERSGPEKAFGEPGNANACMHAAYGQCMLYLGNAEAYFPWLWVAVRLSIERLRNARPDLSIGDEEVLERCRVFAEIGSYLGCPGSGNFPSGHFVVGLYIVLACRNRRRETTISYEYVGPSRLGLSDPETQGCFQSGCFPSVISHAVQIQCPSARGAPINYVCSYIEKYRS
jgi:hypothetical protein